MSRESSYPFWRRLLRRTEWRLGPWLPLYRGRHGKVQCLGPMAFARVLWRRAFGPRVEPTATKPKARNLSVEVGE